MLLLAFALVLNVHTTSAATTNGTSSVNSSVSSDVSAANSTSTTLKSKSVSTSKDVTKPKVVKTDPTKNAAKVDTKKTIKIYFSEKIKFGNGWIVLKNNKKTVSIKTSISGKILTINPVSNLSKDGNYNIYIHTGSLTDMSGNKIKLYKTKFSTVSSKKTVSASLKKYLVPTANCQSTNSKIKALAASITKGSTSDYAKASKIFNWVRDHVSYSFYYNTKKGALGTLNSRSANCVDTAHLVVPLERAAGIPVRYNHGTCKFSSSWYGHVWAQVYVTGKWYYADGTSYRNSFGVIKNWNTKTFTLHGTYASLPFQEDKSMMKKVILGVVVIVAILGIGFAAFNSPKNTTSSTNNSSIQDVQNTTSNTSSVATGNKTISSEEARKIATKYIDVSGATAGTPELVKQDNNWVYIVPIMENGTNVGEIDIDAETGANLGGAGGG